ncbi:hypothetical protein BV22DRAFT_922494 [Leucogyrophana mollusca]|uniref:Uncharacterized protein n=1 Tax=Leucogyrophana mollusca TaxID=85980 RepID=A0ACB8AXI8_9AGAM|nr:hypothetical protein BV22DRAFT_922494 [Leucogyrophana mollusca]
MLFPLGTQSNIAATTIAIALQAFITTYSAGLVLSTQRLALRRNLVSYQTLTATHDLSAGWAGLGSALLSLWRQTSVRASLFGTLCVALYLGGIAVLHVTTSALLSIQTYNTTSIVQVPTTLGVPNFTITDVDWVAASSVTPLLGRMPGLSVAGLSGNTLYDVLLDTSGSGNTTVNATSFDVTCGYFVNVSTTLNPDQSLNAHANYTSYGNYSLEMVVVPLYKNALQPYYPPNTENSLQPWGRHMVFYSTACFGDSAGNQGSLVFPQTEIYNSSNVGVKQTGLRTQIFGCSLSALRHSATVAANSNQLIDTGLLAVTDSKPTIWSPWQPEILPVNIDGVNDPTMDWWSPSFAASPQTTTESSFYHPGLTNEVTYFTDATQYLATLLGLSQAMNTTALDQSAVPSPNVTLAELEKALARVSAATLWTALHLGGNGFTSQNPEVGGTATVSKIVAMGRLNVNLLPLLFGLCASAITFALAVSMTLHSENMTHDPAITSLGVLDLLWLFDKRPDLKEAVSRVNHPETDNLRAAGMVEVRFGSQFNTSTDIDSLRKRSSMRSAAVDCLKTSPRDKV